MKVLYILPRYDYFKKGRNGSVTHAEGIAKGLTENGVEVDVLSGPESKLFLTGAKNNFLNESRGKFLWLLSFAFILLRLSLNCKYDVVIVRFSTKYMPIISIIFKLCRVRNWGIELNSFNYPNYFNRLFKKTIKKIEYLSIKGAFFVNTVSSSLTEEVSKVNKKCFTLPNAGPKSPHPLPDISSYKAGESKNIVYLGAIRDYFDLESIVNVCAGMSNVHFHIFGKIGLLSKLRISDLDKDNCTYYGEYNLETVFENDVFSSEFYFILPYKSGTVADIGSPTKMFEYMSLGVPIISTRVGQPYEVLSSANKEVGEFTYFYDTPSQLEELINKLVKGDNLATLPSQKNILEYYNNNHTWPNRCKEYIKCLKEFVSV